MNKFLRFSFLAVIFFVNHAFAAEAANPEQETKLDKLLEVVRLEYALKIPGSNIRVRNFLIGQHESALENFTSTPGKPDKEEIAKKLLELNLEADKLRGNFSKWHEYDIVMAKINLLNEVLEDDCYPVPKRRQI